MLHCHCCIICRGFESRRSGYYLKRGYLCAKMDNIEEVKIIPPVPGSCPICASRHDPEEPHNRDSLYYLNWFYKKNKRFPTWRDAMSHCNEATKEKFKKKLMRQGITIDTEETRRKS